MRHMMQRSKGTTTPLPRLVSRRPPKLNHTIPREIFLPGDYSTRPRSLPVQVPCHEQEASTVTAIAAPFPAYNCAMDNTVTEQALGELTTKIFGWMARTSSNDGYRLLTINSRAATRNDQVGSSVDINGFAFLKQRTSKSHKTSHPYPPESYDAIEQVAHKHNLDVVQQEALPKAGFCFHRRGQSMNPVCTKACSPTDDLVKAKAFCKTFNIAKANNADRLVHKGKRDDQAKGHSRNMSTGHDAVEIFFPNKGERHVLVRKFSLGLKKIRRRKNKGKRIEESYATTKNIDHPDRPVPITQDQTRTKESKKGNSDKSVTKNTDFFVLMPKDNPALLEDSRKSETNEEHRVPRDDTTSTTDEAVDKLVDMWGYLGMKDFIEKQAQSSYSYSSSSSSASSLFEDDTCSTNSMIGHSSNDLIGTSVSVDLDDYLSYSYSSSSIYAMTPRPRGVKKAHEAVVMTPHVVGVPYLGEPRGRLQSRTSWVSFRIFRGMRKHRLHNDEISLYSL